MTTFEKRSAETAYDDRHSHQQRDNHQQRDSNHERDNHQQRAGLPTAGNMMSAWSIASYDHAEQILKAQRQFFHSMLGATAPMLDVARDVMSPDANEDRSARNQLDTTSDQRHDGSNRSRKSSVTTTTT
jgi:hypothetical protein